MKSSIVALLSVCIIAFAGMLCVAQDDPVPPTDPFDALTEAAAQVANMAAALKPASDAVEAKAETVTRKQTELAEAQEAHNTAKVDFNEALANFIAAVDALKTAAEEIPQANGGGTP